MGKGLRNRELKEAKKQEAQRIAAEKKAKQQKQTKIAAFISAGLAIVIGLTIAITAIINARIDSGDSLRKTIVASTPHHKVTGTMASYFMYDIYSSFKLDNSSYLDSLLDVNKSLKEQPCYYENSKTWFQYFQEATSTYISSYLCFAEMASEAGETLSEESKKYVEETIGILKEYASSADMSFDDYLKSNYGRGVKEQDVRAALELKYLSSQKYNALFESAEITDEQIDKHVLDNKASFYTASYYEFSINAQYDTATADKDTINAAIALAERKANALAACKTVDEFKNYITSYLKELEYTDDQIKSELTNAYYQNQSYKENSELQKWLYSLDRKAGDTKVYEGTEKYIVILIVEPSHLDTAISRNFAHMLLSSDKYGTLAAANTKANEILNQLENGLTKDSFESLAKEYSEQSTVFHLNTVKDRLDDTNVNTWLFDESRKIGDIGIVESDSAIHIVYYYENGNQTWWVDADYALREKYCSTISEKRTSEYRAAINTEGYSDIEI